MTPAGNVCLLENRNIPDPHSVHVCVCVDIHSHTTLHKVLQTLTFHEWMSDITHLEQGRLVGVAWGADPLVGVVQ